MKAVLVDETKRRDFLIDFRGNDFGEGFECGLDGWMDGGIFFPEGLVWGGVRYLLDGCTDFLMMFDRMRQLRLGGSYL